ncbi:phage major capsid protein [Sinomonas sp. G460-2]|uniref:phage major capsid protein n=1 Tax=Sinomonas sp. G460-2 TaxID=3393464 RepID=UPI0039EF4A0B
MSTFDTKMAALTKEAQAVAENKSLTGAQKKQRLDQITAELEGVKKAKSIAYGGGSSGLGPSGLGSSAFGDTSTKGIGVAVPSLSVPVEDARRAFEVLKSGGNFRMELGLKDAASSTTTDGQIIPEYGGLVTKIHEPTRILDLLASTALSAPSVEYIRHDRTVIASNQIAAPVLTLGAASAGGTFPAGAEFWVATYVTATGETTASNEVTATLTLNQQQALSVGAFPAGVIGWNLRRGTTTGNETILVNSTGPITTLTYTDTGSAGVATTVPTDNTTGTAGAIAQGGAYPEATFKTSTMVATAQKIGVHTTLTEELAKDFTQFTDYINNELTRIVIDQENYQLCLGNGSAPNLQGLLNVPGILQRNRQTGAAQETYMLDVFEEAMADLRANNTVFTYPTLIIMNPLDWSTLRRTKDAYGHYLLGDPATTEVESLWGVPVKTITTIPQGTAIMMDANKVGLTYVREGLTLELATTGVTTSGTPVFQNGLVQIKAHERLALAVVRPAAIVKIGVTFTANGS